MKKNCIDEIMIKIQEKVSALPPAEALKLLFDLENRLYGIMGRESIRYGKGIHTKHRHIRYHDFFIDNIEEGSHVLDIGCGNGVLTVDIAAKVKKSTVFGIELNEESVKYAQKKHSRNNVTYVQGDALKDLPDMRFDVIVMSNVLEHIKKRVPFLKSLIKRYNPGKFIIRVPIFERDWRVPLMKELGIDYRLDSTHEIEYRQEDFWAEMWKAGLREVKSCIKWGEIWTVLETKD